MLPKLMLVLAALGSLAPPGRAEKSKFYYMDSLCKNHFLQQLYRKVDGGVIWSRNERNLDCVVTFQTHSVLQRFMLRFDMLQLDCNDRLLVYDGAHAVGAHKADLSCRNTKQQVGAIFTRTNFVTLKYVTDGWGTDANGFKLVITSIKDPKHGCKDFRCLQREFCVSSDLTCDGVDHCGDDSDEDLSGVCGNEETRTVLGLQAAWFVVAAASVALLVLAGAAGAACACRRRGPPQHLHLQPMSGANGAASKGMGDGKGADGETRLSGNCRHPAGMRGYSAARRDRLCWRAAR